jgi:hypothetical protein
MNTQNPNGQPEPQVGGSLQPVVRHLVYRGPEAKTYLCVCSARDKRHALKIARQMFRLPRQAYARPHPEPIPNWL